MDRNSVDLHIFNLIYSIISPLLCLGEPLFETLHLLSSPPSSTSTHLMFKTRRFHQRAHHTFFLPFSLNSQTHPAIHNHKSPPSHPKPNASKSQRPYIQLCEKDEGTWQRRGKRERGARQSARRVLYWVRPAVCMKLEGKDIEYLRYAVTLNGAVRAWNGPWGVGALPTLYLHLIYIG